jgi:hypothetical protein
MEAEVHRRRKHVHFWFRRTIYPNSHRPGFFGPYINWTSWPLRDLLHVGLPLLILKVQAIKRSLPPSFTSDAFDTLLPAISPTTSDIYDRRQCFLSFAWLERG